MGALVAIGVTGCAGSDGSVPDAIAEKAQSGVLDKLAAEKCAEFVPDSSTSHLDAAWFGTLVEAVQLAEGFSSRNTDPRLALSNVDGGTEVAFCSFSGSQWDRMSLHGGQLLAYYANGVPLLRDATLTTTVNGIIGFV